MMANCSLVSSMRVLGVLSGIPRPDPLRAPIVPATKQILGQMGDSLNVLEVLPVPHPGSPTPGSPLVSDSTPLIPVL